MAENNVKSNKMDFSTALMPLEVILIFLLKTSIGWLTEALSFYLTQQYMINNFMPGYPLIASGLGAVSDIAKCLGIIYLVLYPIKHVWEKYEIGWNWSWFSWVESFVNWILSLIKTVVGVLKKESRRTLLWIIIIQGISISCIATRSALTVSSYESNKDSNEYKNIEYQISQKEAMIQRLADQNKLKEKEIASNTGRIDDAGYEIGQTRYKSNVYQNEAGYRNRNLMLDSQIEANNQEISGLHNDIFQLKNNLVKVEKSDTGYGNTLFVGITGFLALFGIAVGIVAAIFIFSFGVEGIGAFFLAWGIKDNQQRILDWIDHQKQKIKIRDATQFMKRKQKERERFLLAVKQISARGSVGVTTDEIAAVLRSSDYSIFDEKFNPGHVLTEREIGEIEEKLKGRSLPSPAQELPGGINREQLNSVMVNGRPLTDPEKLELSEAMANLPGVYGDDTPEFQRLKKLIDGWKTGNVQEKRYGFLPENDGEPNTPERPTEHSAEHPENERSPGVRRTTPNTLPNTLPNTKNEQFGEQFTEHRTPDIEQPPNSKNSGGKSSEEAEKIIIEVAQKNPTASVREIGKIAGELAFQRKIKKNSNPYSPGTVQPIIKKKVRK